MRALLEGLKLRDCHCHTHEKASTHEFERLLAAIFLVIPDLTTVKSMLRLAAAKLTRTSLRLTCASVRSFHASMSLNDDNVYETNK